MELFDNYYLISKINTNNIARALKKQGIIESFTGDEIALKIRQLPSANVLYHTEVPYDDEKASQIAAVAQSYLDAIEDGRLTIVYQAGYGILDGVNQKFKTDDGTYCIHCSGFAGLVLRGIAYENSPYADDDGSKVSARTDLFTWANTDYEKGGHTGANQVAQYAFQTGCMLNSNDISKAKKGDILFYTNYNSDYFGSIWHIALVLEDGGTTCVHALYGKSSGIWTYDGTNPPSSMQNLKYIARPRYNINFTELATMFKIVQQPVSYSGVVGSTASFTVMAEGDGLTYKWQYSNGQGWFDSSFSGYNTNTQIVEVASFRNGQQYRCIITDSNGAQLISDVVSITITEEPL